MSHTVYLSDVLTDGNGCFSLAPTMTKRRTIDGTRVTTDDGKQWLVSKIVGRRGFRLFARDDDDPEMRADDGVGFSWSDDFDRARDAFAWLSS